MKELQPLPSIITYTNVYHYYLASKTSRPELAFILNQWLIIYWISLRS